MAISLGLGYSFLLIAGCCIVLFSSLVFAIGSSYLLLFAARCIQGVGSAALTISGMCLIAERYPDDKDRSRAMGIALGGIALGVLVGYPFGAVFYSSVGKACPFLLIAAFILIDIGLQTLILKPSMNEKAPTHDTPMMRLLQDPYILISSGAITFTTMAMASLEPTLPLWTMKTMGANRWQLGLIFIPDSVGYLIGTNGFGVIARSIGRWICALACMLLMGLCLICLPFATAIPHLILPHFGIGLSLGITDAALMPLLALLMDTRHEAAYGSVYAIAQLAVCLAYSVGPAIAGQIVRAVGFKWLLRGLACVVLLYSPLCYCLRNPPVNDETLGILDSKGSQELYMEETDKMKSNFNYNRLHDFD